MSPPGGAFRGGGHLQVVAWCLNGPTPCTSTPREAILLVTGLIPHAMYVTARLGRHPYPLGPQATALAPAVSQVPPSWPSQVGGVLQRLLPSAPDMKPMGPLWC